MENPPQKHKAKRLSRRFPSGDIGPPARLHARLVGEVVWAWNDLHRSLVFAFTEVIGSKNPIMGMGIWAALPTDKAQRGALVAALNAQYSDKSGIRKRLLWAIAQTNKLAEYRNDLMHTAMGFRLEPREPITSPSFMGTPFKRIMRLRAVDIYQLLRTLRGDLMQLSEYVSEIARRIGSVGTLGPWPRKPRMHTPQLFQGQNPRNRPKPHWKKQARRPRP